MKSEHASGGRLGTLKPRVRSASVMDFRTRYITTAYGVDLSDYKDLHPGRVTIERGVLRQSISYVPPSLHNYDVATISNKRLYLIIMVSAVDREIDIERCHFGGFSDCRMHDRWVQSQSGATKATFGSLR